MQLQGPFADEDSDIVTQLRLAQKWVAELRKQELAHSSNKEVSRRPPEGAPKFAVGMVVKNKMAGPAS